MSKRFFIGFIAILALSAVFLTACSGSLNDVHDTPADVHVNPPDAHGKAKHVNVQEVYNKLIATGNFSEMIKVPERELNEIYGIDTGKLKQYVFYMSENSSINADEIAIFEVSDPEYAAELEKICNKRLERQREITSSYAPDEFAKLKPIEVRRAGNYVYYAVGNNYRSLIKILKANIG